MKTVPFVANHEDNIHCVPAVFRMLSKFFFNEDLTWEQIDRISHAVPGKGTWTFPLETYLAKKGLDVTNIEPIDYGKLYKEGPEYVRQIVGKDTADDYLKNSNLSNVIECIPEFLENVKHETRRVSVTEIVSLLESGDCLIGTEINSRILNNRDGFSLHFVLLYGYENGEIVLHDPGLPPQEGRRITVNEFTKCFAYEGATMGIDIFKKG